MLTPATPAPTPTPTPSPTPSPTPTPVPVPTPTPTGIPVPSSIDATGATNVATALTNFFATVPNGSTVVFKAGGVYRVQPGLLLWNRTNLVLEGNGATIRNVGWDRSALAFRGGSHITVRNLTLAGDNPDAGTAAAYHSGGSEQSGGLDLFGVSNAEIANVTMTGAWGDCLYVAPNGTAHVWSDTVSWHDSTCRLNGRNAVVVNGGNNVTIERVRFDQIAMSVLDIEPNYTYEGATNVKLINNSVGVLDVATAWACLFVAADGVAGSTVSNVTISGNTVAGNPAGYRGKPCALNTDVTVSRRTNFVFTNNTTALPVAGPVLVFNHVDGLTITGNVQPLSSGTLASISDSTGVTYRP